jgi:hypothetical protein
MPGNRKRSTLQTAYAGGYVPWTWWCEDSTANPDVGDRIGFFQQWGFEKPEESRWEPVVLRPAALYRPACAKCGSSSVADIHPDWECMSCGHMFGKRYTMREA